MKENRGKKPRAGQPKKEPTDTISTRVLMDIKDELYSKYRKGERNKLIADLIGLALGEEITPLRIKIAAPILRQLLKESQSGGVTQLDLNQFISNLIDD
jgi:hypothetical protein